MATMSEDYIIINVNASYLPYPCLYNNVDFNDWNDWTKGYWKWIWDYK